jgi:serine/threonine-protein kinase
MAIEDMKNDPARARTARFCSECGEGLTGGRFCAGCGHPADLVGPSDPFPRHEAAVERGADVASDGVGNGNASAPPVTERRPLLDEIAETARLGVPPPASPPLSRSDAMPGGAGRSNRPIFVACVLLLAAGVIAALVILLSGGSSESGADPNAAYADEVAASFKPVDSANRRLSSALERLDGAKPPSAGTRAALARARTATSTARGALGALTVPQGSEGLQTQMRQALDREETYLRAVNLALTRPAGPGVSGLQGLAGNLTNSLEAIGAPIAGAAQNVTGADALTAWAQRVRRSKAGRKPAAGAPAPAPAPAPGASAAPAPPVAYVTEKDCLGGVTVSSTTSCPFAHNVREAWRATSGTANTVTAYSDATGRTYDMTCAPVSGGITCKGGVNAVVSFRG